jgi:hypothetical protein
MRPSRGAERTTKRPSLNTLRRMTGPEANQRMPRKFARTITHPRDNCQPCWKVQISGDTCQSSAARAAESRVAEGDKRGEHALDAAGLAILRRRHRPGQGRQAMNCPKCGNELGPGTTKCWRRGCDFIVVSVPLPHPSDESPLTRNSPDAEPLAAEGPIPLLEPGDHAGARISVFLFTECRKGRCGTCSKFIRTRAVVVAACECECHQRRADAP